MSEPRVHDPVKEPGETSGAHLDVADGTTLHQWRELTLHRLATAFLALAIPVIGVLVWHHAAAGRNALALTVLVMASLLIPIRFAGRLPYRVRAGMLVALFVAGGAVTYGMVGIASGGAAMLASASLLGALLLGRRWGFALLAVTTLSLASVGALHVYGVLPPPDVMTQDVSLVGNWVRATLFFGGVSGTAVIAAVFLVGRLERSLLRSQSLVVSLQQEIFEREQAEEQRHTAERSLRHAQKMEAIGTLAGGIAHDFNNILAGVLGYTELAREDAAGNPELQHNLDQVLLAANRARELVAQILAFSRQREGQRRPMRIQPVAREALQLLRASIPANIEIRHTIEEGCGPVLADATQIHQVLMNLCTNAYLAMPRAGGLLEIGLRELQLDAAAAAAYPELGAGRYVDLRVSDTGVGMDHATQARIFEPYYTTRAKGEGTGLGLAVVHSIVRSSQGAILVSSEPGRGTTFRVLLPVCEPVPEPPARADSEPPPTGTERVLFVDDEVLLTEVSRIALERLGYRVASFAGGAEALAAFEAAPDGFDVIVTDLGMPQMNGFELTRRIRQRSPAIPVIACTGFSEATTERQLRDAGINRLVMKPVVARDLARAIREVLEG